jgi:hypothetical protein
MEYKLKCPPECTNTDAGTCPRCFRETGIGCGHGDLCEECRADLNGIKWQNAEAK